MSTFYAPQNPVGYESCHCQEHEVCLSRCLWAQEPLASMEHWRETLKQHAFPGLDDRMGIVAKCLLDNEFLVVQHLDHADPVREWIGEILCVCKSILSLH